jgi:hypothetical protein
MNNRIFSANYKLRLPAPAVIKAEIEREKQRLLEMNISKNAKDGE